MTDAIRIDGIEADTIVGVFDWERRVRQRLRIDVDLRCDLRAAGASDRLEDTVDYKSVTTTLRTRIAASRYRLVESVAGDVADACLRDERVSSVRVTVHKPAALRHAQSVSVRVERARGEACFPPHRALVGVGSNIEPLVHVRSALARLHEEFGAVRVSTGFWTEPKAGATGDRFLNLAVEFRTELGPGALVDLLHAIEDESGRERPADASAPRTLDLDLLLYDDAVRVDEPPRLPHRLLATAAFVLVPAAEIAGDVLHPTEGVTLEELRARLPERVPGVEPLDDEVLY